MLFQLAALYKSKLSHSCGIAPAVTFEYMNSIQLFSVPFQLLLLPFKGQYEGLTSKSIPYL